EAGGEKVCYLDAPTQGPGGPDDGLPKTRRAAPVGGKKVGALFADPPVLSNEGGGRGPGKKRPPLGKERGAGLAVLPFLQEEILALVKTQHRAAVELTGLRILREEDRIVNDELRKLLDYHLYKAPVITVGSGGTPVYLERAMRLFVERDDLSH